MDKQKCKKKESRDIVISVRVTKSMSRFMDDNKLSPSMVMINALEDLGFEPNSE